MELPLWTFSESSQENFCFKILVSTKYPFQPNVSFLYPLETLGNIWFSEIFKEYKNEGYRSAKVWYINPCSTWMSQKYPEILTQF